MTARAVPWYRYRVPTVLPRFRTTFLPLFVRANGKVTSLRRVVAPGHRTRLLFHRYPNRANQRIMCRVSVVRSLCSQECAVTPRLRRRIPIFNRMRNVIRFNPTGRFFAIRGSVVGHPFIVGNATRRHRPKARGVGEPRESSNSHSMRVMSVRVRYLRCKPRLVITLMHRLLCFVKLCVYGWTRCVLTLRSVVRLRQVERLQLRIQIPSCEAMSVRVVNDEDDRPVKQVNFVAQGKGRRRAKQDRLMDGVRLERGTNPIPWYLFLSYQVSKYFVVLRKGKYVR